jgi:hypothetical protein
VVEVFKTIVPKLVAQADNTVAAQFPPVTEVRLLLE